MKDIEFLNICHQIIDEAGKLHDDTNQMFDDKPYSYHTSGVARLAMTYCGFLTDDKATQLAIVFGAAFHDSIEDARLTYNDVMKIAKKYFDDKRAYIATEIVYALTNEKGRNRQERANDKYYFGIVTTPYAPFVKMCDRMFNMTYSKNSGSSMFRKYCEELPHFISAIQTIPGVTMTRDIEYQIPSEMIEELEKLKVS